MTIKETGYSQESFTKKELEDLGQRAIEILEETLYGKKMRKLLIAVTLAQGAALHYAVKNHFAARYLDPQETGVKDIDVWFFFKETKEQIHHPRWHKHRDYGESKFGRYPKEPQKYKHYKGRRIDFFGRSVEVRGNEPVRESICRWIPVIAPESPYYRRLPKKAVVGIYPDNILGKIIWVNPDLV